MKRNELEKRVLAHINKIKKNKSDLPDTLQPLFKTMIDYWDKSYSDGIIQIERVKDELCLWMEKEGISTYEELADSTFARLLLSKFLNTSHLERFIVLLRSLPLMPYTSFTKRQSLRTAAIRPHVENWMRELYIFLKIQESKMSMKQLLTTPNTHNCNGEANPISDTYMAVALMQGDKMVEDYIYSFMEGDTSGNQRLEYDLFRAIGKSGNKRLLEAEGRLLTATHLQEGLRQTIMKTANAGKPESYQYLLGIVEEQGLQRFSSVKRCLMVTTGMVMESTKLDNKTDKVLKMMTEMLLHTKDATQYVHSDNAMEVFLGLWGIGFYEVMNALPMVQTLIEQVKPNRVQAAILWLGTLQWPEAINPYIDAAILRWKDDMSVMAGLMNLLCNEPELREYRKKQKSNESHELINALKDVLANLKDNRVFYPYVFPWICRRLRKEDIAYAICLEALRSGDSDLMDEVCIYLPQCNADERHALVEEITYDSPLRRLLLFSLLTDRSWKVRDSIMKKVVSLTLTDEVVTALEDALSMKYTDLRFNIIINLLKLPNNRLQTSLQRLLADNVVERRLAALDLLKQAEFRKNSSELFTKIRPFVENIKQPTDKEKELIAMLYDKKLSPMIRNDEGNKLKYPGITSQVVMKDTSASNRTDE